METNTKLIHATDDSLEQLLSTEQLVLLDFGAEWCGPCKVMLPILGYVAEKYEGKAVVAKIDVDTNPQATVKYGVRNLPTLLFIQNGVVVDKVVGAVPEKAVADKIERLV